MEDQQIPKDAANSYRDTMLGAIDNGEGGMFVMFLRSHESPFFSVSRVMLQGEKGDVFEVSDCKNKGFLSKQFIITLTPKAGRAFELTPRKYLEVQKGGMARGLAVASSSAEYRKEVGDNYFPEDFWTSIPPDKLNEMIPQKWA
jgi:hypothetical protein